MQMPLHEPAFYAGDPFPTYRWLRREAPVFWYETRGWWALSRYEDVRYVSSHPELFISSQGIMIPDTGEMTPDQLDLLIFNDPPRHRELRALLKGGFTPHAIGKLEPRLRAMAREIVEAIPEGVEIDFAEEVAAPLPTVVIAQLIGAPAQDWERFRAWSDAIIGAQDPDQTMHPDEAHAGLHAYFMELIELRRREPQDDLLSGLIAAQRGGAAVTDGDLYAFCWLLLIAGNETTRNLIALGTQALLEHPDQLEMLVRDPDLVGRAIEEMLRWCCPVSHMVRTAVRDVELRGQRIQAGQRLVMLYGAANRDEEVFGPDAESFRIDRHPNRHVQFGFGEHICIGAHLARLEARVMFEELLPRLAHAELTGDVKRVLSSMVPGVKRMPVRFAA
jgi:cytochrome P450